MGAGDFATIESAEARHLESFLERLDEFAAAAERLDGTPRPWRPYSGICLK